MQKTQLAAALIAVLGLSFNGMARAEGSDAEGKSEVKTEKKAAKVKEVKKAAKQGADSSCGEGSCGTDKKGAKAAEEKHKAK